MSSKKIAILLIVVAVLVILIYGYTQAISDNPIPKPGEVQKVDIDTTKISGYAKLAGIGVAVFAGLYILYKIFASRYGVIIVVVLVGLALVGSLIYYNGFSIDSEGKPHTQVVRMVQPSGSDPSMDRQYSIINRDNATTNILTASSFAIYAFLAVIVFVIVVLLGIRVQKYG